MESYLLVVGNAAITLVGTTVFWMIEPSASPTLVAFVAFLFLNLATIIQKAIHA